MSAQIQEIKEIERLKDLRVRIVFQGACEGNAAYIDSVCINGECEPVEMVTGMCMSTFGVMLTIEEVLKEFGGDKYVIQALIRLLRRLGYIS